MSSEAAAPGRIERLLSRETLIVATALAGAVLLAWLWLYGQAADEMAMAGMGVEPWSAGYLLPAFAMWLLMMVAMMLPSASPMILFYVRFARRSGMAGAVPASLAFALTYLLIWTFFSALAALLQAALVSAGLVSAMALTLGDRRIAGALLILAAAWQLSPLKTSCLAACRSPLDFLMRLWRPGLRGAVRLGAAHGLYCLGCCWSLMLLLFVGGVMNLAWIAGLALLVLVEKLAPAWLPARLGLAFALAVGGAFFVVVPR